MNRKKLLKLESELRALEMNIELCGDLNKERDYENDDFIEEIDDEIKVITPVFKEYRDGKYKIISTKAKRARGLMTSFIIKNKIESIEALKEFKEEGYEFCDEMSTDSELTFILNYAIYVE